MDRKRRDRTIGICLAVVAVAFGAWWFLHDPFRTLSSHETYDSTTLYKADGRVYVTPRKVRTVYFKDLTMERLLASIKGSYPAAAGWVWSVKDMPLSFRAIRLVPNEKQPEQVYATQTPENTLELVETRTMSPAEIQLVIRSQGSDAFINNPEVRTPHHRDLDNPRLAFAD